MDLAPLTPLYERPGPWATAYLDTSVADEATHSRRELKVSVENTWEENARTVAAAVEDAAGTTGARLVVLVGDARERHSVRAALPGHLPALVVETEHGGRAAGSDTARLDERIAQERRAYSRRHAADTLERFTAAKARDGGRTDAADGVPALVDAAREHRID
ncbi:hypothetical protein ACIQRW_01840 [Streptomyces sp. NPDC091287]|uniref:baeRF2 domain-containing protein n=1 Tax=Streptomyces sp. NPDC091287 TaxID=3365988 RepID=UPI00382F922B